MSAVTIDCEHNPDTDEMVGHVTVRSFRYQGSQLTATLWVGNENAGQEASVMLTRTEVLDLVKALKATLTEDRL